jgi:hypothetical protein
MTGDEFFQGCFADYQSATADCRLPTAFCSTKEGALAASVDYQTEPISPIPYTLSAKVSASQW